MSTIVTTPSAVSPWQELARAARRRGRSISWPMLLYGAVVLLTACWVLSLPLFPSQDEPLHLYYVAVFKELLLHQHTVYTNVYQVRHFLPPYATYYYALIGLSRFVSLETADQIVAAFNVVFLAVSGAILLRVLQPAARWSPFLLLPVLLNWTLFMGFANFMLSVSLALLALAAWCAGRERAGWRHTRVFLALVALMILTHPLPWVFTLGFAALELAVRWWQGSLRSTRTLARDLLALGLAATSYVYLLPFRSSTQVMTRLVLDRRSQAWRPILSPVHLHRLYAQGFSLVHTQGIVLFLKTGLPRVDRLAFGLLFGGSVLLAAGAGVARRLAWGRSRLTLPEIWFVYMVLLSVGIVLVPDSGVGGYYISTRMQLLAYLCCVVAVAPALERRRTLARATAAYATLLSLLTLALAIRYIDPVARTIAQLHTVPLPQAPAQTTPAAPGAALISLARSGPGLLMRPVGAAFPPFLNFDAYAWAPVHYFRWHQLLLFNTAWLGDKLIPIQPRPEALPLLDGTFFNQAPEVGDRLLLSQSTAARNLARVRFVVLQRAAVKSYQNPFALLGGSSSPGPFADNWTCTDQPSHHWYLCQPRPHP